MGIGTTTERVSFMLSNNYFNRRYFLKSKFFWIPKRDVKIYSWIVRIISSHLLIVRSCHALAFAAVYRSFACRRIVDRFLNSSWFLKFFLLLWWRFWWWVSFCSNMLDICVNLHISYTGSIQSNRVVYLSFSLKQPF